MTCGMTVAPMIPTASSSASPLEGRREEVVGHLARVGRDLEQLERERRDDHADEHGDHRLEPPEAGGLQREDRERGDDGDHRAPAERDPEQQAEPERRAEHLGQVGRHRDHLRLQPQAERDAPRETARGRPRRGCGRSRSPASPRASGRASPSGSRRAPPTAAGSRTWRRRRRRWRSCPGRRTRPTR